MPLTAPEPKTVEAVSVPEKQFPHRWFGRWVIDARSPDDPGFARIDWQYHNATTGDTEAEFAGSIQSDALMTAVAEVPEVAAAYQALLDAVEPLEAWVAAQQAEPEPEPEPAP